MTNLLIDRSKSYRAARLIYSTEGTTDWVTGTLYNGGVPNSVYSIATGGGLSNSAVAITKSGNVGIGTTSPTEKLHVQGKVAASAFVGTSPVIFEAPAGTERMRIDDTTGNVGIGTTSPESPLHVADHVTVGPFAATTGVGGIDVTGPFAEFGFVRRTLTSWPSTPATGDRFVWYNSDGTAPC